MTSTYDTKHLYHLMIWEEVGADSIIPGSDRDRRVRLGAYQQELYTTFNEERYQERNKVATAFSVLKRGFREKTKA